MKRQRAKVYTNALYFCLLIFAFFLLPSSTLAETLSGRVVSIHDADTITILDGSKTQHRIRLGAIDAPEMGQDYGQRAKEYLAEQVFGKEVLIEYSKRDKYGRIVGKILLEGKDINLDLISAGFAWHYKTYEKEQSVADRSLYAEAEVLARENKLGLWREPHPMPPWEYRKNDKMR